MTTNTESSAETLTRLMREYQETQLEMAEYRAEYGPMITHLEHLEEEIQLARAALTEALAETGIDYIEDDQIAVSLVVQDRGQYDVSRLPDSPAIREMMTHTISRDAIKKLIKQRVITREQAEAAWDPKPAKPSARITPKAVTG